MRIGDFFVVGVDIKPQKRYPFMFIQADALEFVRRNARHFAAIHASPPCQRYAGVTAFESNVPLMAPEARCDHDGLLPFMHKGERAYADAMGCTWMSNREGRQAIPPAYTEYIGRQLIDHIGEVAA